MNANTTAAPAAAPAAPTVDAQPSADPFSLPEDQIEHMDDVFGFAEVDKNSSEKSGGAGNSGEPAVGAADGKGGEEGLDTPPSPPDSPAPTSDTDRELELANLKGTLEEVRAELAKQKEEATKATTAPEPAAAEPAAEAKPVSIKLPEAFKNKLFGESVEEAGGAIDELVSGIYTTINQALNQVITGIPKMVQQELAKQSGAAPANTGTAPATGEPAATAEDQNEQYRTRYYSKFPNHNTDAIRPILNAVAVEMATQFPAAPFDDRYIASLGSRVEERLKKLVELSRPSNQSASLPSGTRSAEPALGGDDIAEQVQALFS